MPARLHFSFSPKTQTGPSGYFPVFSFSHMVSNVLEDLLQCPSTALKKRHVSLQMFLLEGSSLSSNF